MSEPEARPNTNAPMPKANAIGISESNKMTTSADGAEKDEHGYLRPRRAEASLQIQELMDRLENHIDGGADEAEDERGRPQPLGPAHVRAEPSSLDLEKRVLDREVAEDRARADAERRHDQTNALHGGRITHHHCQNAAVDVLAVACDVSDSQEVEPGAEEQGQLLNSHEWRGEGVPQHHLGEHQPGKAETERNDEDVEDALDDRLGRDHPAQFCRQRALGQGGEAFGRLNLTTFRIGNRQRRILGGWGALLRLPNHGHVSPIEKRSGCRNTRTL